MGTSEINKKNYKWVQLNETIFHPKGGGQLSDEGTISGVQVAYVHKVPLNKNDINQFEILHCFNGQETLPFKEGNRVELLINPSMRILYSQMHTAGHVLAGVVNEIFPSLEGHHGNHDPKDGYVKFKMLSEISSSKEEILQKTQAALHSKLDTDLPVLITSLPSGMRAIQIGAQIMGCGGTHVHHLKELPLVEITDVSINKKENTVTIKYKLSS